MRTGREGDREVSAIGLGAMPMSVREHNDEERGLETIRRALERYGAGADVPGRHQGRAHAPRHRLEDLVALS